MLAHRFGHKANSDVERKCKIDLRTFAGNINSLFKGSESILLNKIQLRTSIESHITPLRNYSDYIKIRYYRFRNVYCNRI